MHVLFPQACGPQYGYMCGVQQYISGVCANVSSSFQILNSVAPAVQGTQPDKNVTHLIREGQIACRGWEITHLTEVPDPDIKLTTPSSKREITAFFLM